MTLMLQLTWYLEDKKRMVHVSVYVRIKVRACMYSVAEYCFGSVLGEWSFLVEHQTFR